MASPSPPAREAPSACRNFVEEGNDFAPAWQGCDAPLLLPGPSLALPESREEASVSRLQEAFLEPGAERSSRDKDLDALPAGGTLWKSQQSAQHQASLAAEEEAALCKRRELAIDHDPPREPLASSCEQPVQEAAACSSSSAPFSPPRTAALPSADFQDVLRVSEEKQSAADAASQTQPMEASVPHAKTDRFMQGLEELLRGQTRLETALQEVAARQEAQQRQLEALAEKLSQLAAEALTSQQRGGLRRAGNPAPPSLGQASSLVSPRHVGSPGEASSPQSASAGEAFMHAQQQRLERARRESEAVAREHELRAEIQRREEEERRRREMIEKQEAERRRREEEQQRLEAERKELEERQRERLRQLQEKHRCIMESLVGRGSEETQTHQGSLFADPLPSTPPRSLFDD